MTVFDKSVNMIFCVLMNMWYNGSALVRKALKIRPTQRSTRLASAPIKISPSKLFTPGFQMLPISKLWHFNHGAEERDFKSCRQIYAVPITAQSWNTANTL